VLNLSKTSPPSWLETSSDEADKTDKARSPEARPDSERRPEDLAPARGLLVGVALGTVLWVMAIYALLRATH
jgi:hypothetical protein